MKFLPHFGLLAGLGMIWYGRKTSSDLRIIGYIIVAPSLFGLMKTYSGVDLSGKIVGGAPKSGEALPQGSNAVTDQSTMYPGIKGSTFVPGGSSVARFGSQASGGLNVNTSADAKLTPPGSYGKRY